MQLWDLSLRCSVPYPQARKALADRQKELELKTQQLEIKLSNKIEEDIKKARRKSTQAGQSQGSKVKLPGHCGVAVSLRCLLLRGGEHCPSGSHMSVPVIHSVTKSGCGLLIRRDFSSCQLYFSINGPALQKNPAFKCFLWLYYRGKQKKHLKHFTFTVFCTGKPRI